ncbi:MAG: PSD1 and planctomycete cytochrome C domain-containing protein [Fuerstiella sp.]|nr:PSD1 and planctomycete cytochrome C domain-containing protein [Fuerstiella sp.]
MLSRCKYLDSAFLQTVIICASVSAAADEHERFFESQIRPILARHCLECHGPTEQSGGLRLDSRDHLMKGSESGPVVTPGNPDTSRFIHAVRGSKKLAMPPDEQLSSQQISALEHWVLLGMPWPAAGGPISDPKGEAALNHWAFQPVRDVTPPRSARYPVRTPVDSFIFRRLEQQQLSPSPAADARSLIRRATIGLTGLPPSPDAVEHFIESDESNRWEQLIDHLLESPGYGEQWARHWLDIARYSDTKGYVYAREERRWVHSWSYRDWVVEALNADMPYDRFLLMQLAADQVSDRKPHDLAAMGFLTLGRRFLGVTRDIMDDRIDTITRGTMALTVACARCHDHKYDPIPTTDYYALYGVLNSCEEQRVELPSMRKTTAEWQEKLEVRRKNFQDRYNSERLIASERCRDKLADYLRVQNNLESVPVQGFDQVLLPNDVIPEFARRWENYLRYTRRTNDPVFRHWHAFAALSADTFAAEATHVLQDLNSPRTGRVNSRIATAFAHPPKSFSAVIETYIAALASIRDEWRQVIAQSKREGKEPPSRLANPIDEQLRQVLFGPRSPCDVPNERLVHNEYLFTSAICSELWGLQKEIDRWLNKAPHQPRYALTLADRSIPNEPRVFRRGNPKSPGQDVPRRFLSILSDDPRASFRSGSGRYELAQAIIDPANPLTARVMVNRVWAWHFGRGLVATPSDFGVRAGQPSHPDLLDWLTRDFVRHGWSLKHLHRRILRSATYRQSSTQPTDPKLQERITLHDPSNRLLWKMPLHRLTFEEFRDSILAVSSELNRHAGGRPAELFGQKASLRRTIYGEIDRQFFPAALRIFDVANPDIHIPRRSETTVPQQALFYLNHPLVQQRARKLAALTAKIPSPKSRVETLFQQVIQRTPRPDELTDALKMVTMAELPPPSVRLQARDWNYLYGTFNEEQDRVVDAKPIPVFRESTWQGGTTYPDKDLGRVQLTATGGHPGNDRQHACIRRWTASRNMKITIVSTLIHQPKSGDGIRAFIVSSKTGKLAGQTVHQQTVDLSVTGHSVTKGDTIDFVADINEVLNGDQFLWEIKILESENVNENTTWNSTGDFSGPVPESLTPWEQLAQVLLCSNEFLFVD